MNQTQEEILTPLISEIGYNYQNLKSVPGYSHELLKIAEKAMEQYADQRISIPEIKELVNDLIYTAGYLPSPVRVDIEKQITKLKYKLQ